MFQLAGQLLAILCERGPAQGHAHIGVAVGSLGEGLGARQRFGRKRPIAPGTFGGRQQVNSFHENARPGSLADS